MALQLYIGNKNYSSWSMRPWVLMRQVGIEFEEIQVRFDGFEPDSRFKQTMRRVSPTAQVPVLVDDGWPIWDTLAIAEHLAERFPEHRLWPQDRRARARARQRGGCARGSARPSPWRARTWRPRAGGRWHHRPCRETAAPTR